MLDKETIKYLDSLSDAEFIYLMHIRFGATLPQWDECTKEEFEKYCGDTDDHVISEESLIRLVDNIANNREYRAVPFWNNGGGIMDQMSGREPDGYKYEKCTGYKKVLMMGGDMVDYCSKRECMKPYFEEAT